jgi:hypothetical protein
VHPQCARLVVRNFQKYPRAPTSYQLPAASSSPHEQEDAAADEAVELEEDLSDEEADSAGPVKWVVPAWEVLAADSGGWRAGLKRLKVNES